MNLKLKKFKFDENFNSDINLWWLRRVNKIEDEDKDQRILQGAEKIYIYM